MRRTSILALLALTTACGSRRIAGYLEDLENCSATSSTTDEPGTTQSSSSSEDTTASGGSFGTTVEGSGTGSGTGTTEGNTDTIEATTDASTGEPATECGNGVRMRTRTTPRSWRGSTRPTLRSRSRPRRSRS